ncbi:hypothetical protein BU23DRAFT_563594 [Bimuria novae-zelandiae CBS 107.79]|uniref:Uncharacterized protein n=1 Tax=Bimuria novae-zelandiae CBS 107.79 TaxID=1447943 RepID=A0A6A5VUM0_9PLEO|nr:hypothetical protein BU23DRAFT_563594 [Bimuria novae-zelandiae CBS 107.79]
MNESAEKRYETQSFTIASFINEKVLQGCFSEHNSSASGVASSLSPAALLYIHPPAPGLLMHRITQCRYLRQVKPSTIINLPRTTTKSLTSSPHPKRRTTMLLLKSDYSSMTRHNNPYWTNDRIYGWDDGYNNGSVRWNDDPRGWGPSQRRDLRHNYSYGDLHNRFQSEHGGGPTYAPGARPRFSAGFWYPPHMNNLDRSRDW